MYQNTHLGVFFDLMLCAKFVFISFSIQKTYNHEKENHCLNQLFYTD